MNKLNINQPLGSPIDSQKTKGTVVLAIGGNSIIKDNQSQSVQHQQSAIEEMVKPVADLIAAGYGMVLTHGNGPQVGLELHRSELGQQNEDLPAVPLVNCVANTQGGIGYQIQQALQNELVQRNIHQPVVTLLTQVTVNPEDPAFLQPTKPIGSFFSLEESQHLSTQNPDWLFVEDSGRGYRRVVASPQPVKIVELASINALIKQGVIVIALGGGGIPVIELANQKHLGVDAVIDKDLSTELLARSLKADILLITTGVEKVAVDFGKPSQRNLDRVSTVDVEAYAAQGHFPAGSMLPKINAALSFVKSGGKRTIITTPDKLLAALQFKTGTHIEFLNS